MTIGRRFQKAVRGTFTVLTLALAAVLIWAVLDLYLEGRALRLADPSAVIFSREAVAARLSVVLPVSGVWLAAWIAVLAAAPAEMPLRSAASKVRSAAPSVPDRRAAFLRDCLLVLALILLILGVLNGGLRDVLIKAANLCTECIGLG